MQSAETRPLEGQQGHRVEAQRERETERLINVPSLSFALITTIVGIVFMTILSEENPGFQDRLTDMAGHHWVAKGLISLGVFVVAWLLSAFPLQRQQDSDVAVRRWVLGATGTALAGIVVIFLYFVGHFAAE
jgi:hypothetical protein